MKITDEMVEAALQSWFSKFPSLHGDKGYLAEMRAALTAALAAQPQQRVEVKKLEWHREPKKLFARSPFIQVFYEIRRFDMGQGRWKYKLEAFGSWLGPFFDLESEAVAFAQADFETRIRSALVDVPSVESEPEGGGRSPSDAGAQGVK